MHWSAVVLFVYISVGLAFFAHGLWLTASPSRFQSKLLPVSSAGSRIDAALAMEVEASASPSMVYKVVKNLVQVIASSTVVWTWPALLYVGRSPSFLRQRYKKLLAFEQLHPVDLPAATQFLAVSIMLLLLRISSGPQLYIDVAILWLWGTVSIYVTVQGVSKGLLGRLRIGITNTYLSFLLITLSLFLTLTVLNVLILRGTAETIRFEDFIAEGQSILSFNKLTDLWSLRSESWRMIATRVSSYAFYLLMIVQLARFKQFRMTTEERIAQTILLITNEDLVRAQNILSQIPKSSGGEVIYAWAFLHMAQRSFEEAHADVITWFDLEGPAPPFTDKSTDDVLSYMLRLWLDVNFIPEENPKFVQFLMDYGISDGCLLVSVSSLASYADDPKKHAEILLDTISSRDYPITATFIPFICSEHGAPTMKDEARLVCRKALGLVQEFSATDMTVLYLNFLMCYGQCEEISSAVLADKALVYLEDLDVQSQPSWLKIFLLNFTELLVQLARINNAKEFESRASRLQTKILPTDPIVAAELSRISSARMSSNLAEYIRGLSRGNIA